MSTDAVPITFISSSAEVGGAELYLESLLESLGSGWVDAVVVPEEGEFAARLRGQGHPVEVIAFGRRLGLLAAAARLRSFLRARNSALVHANGSRAAIVSALAAGRRQPVVWLRVDHTLDGAAGRLIARRCAYTVAVSDSVLSGLGGGRRRGEVIYPGVPAHDVDRGAGRSLVQSVLGCPADSEVIVLSGRIGPAKGQSELIAAVPSVLRRRPAVRIALLGGPRVAYPGYEAELRDQAGRLGVDDRVHFLGHRRDEIQSVGDAMRFVSGCDLLVAPSMLERPYGWREGFGLAVAESLHVGTPVVAYRNGSLPEVLGPCGRVVREGDVAGLAEAINELLDDDSLRQEMSDCGRDRAARLFRRDQAIAAMKRVYVSHARRDRAQSR